MKNVHVSGVTGPSSGVTCPRDQITEDHSDEDMSAVEQIGAAGAVKRRRTQQTADAMTYRCIVCGYSAHSVGAIARHQLRHSAWSLPLRCRHCAYRATTLRLLTRHVKTQHQVQSLTDDQHQLACGLCPHNSSSATQAATHERRHHGARRRYQCHYCTYSVDRRHLAVRHRRLHNAGDSVTLRCPSASCPFTCRDRDQMTLHGRQHAGATVLCRRRRLYRCDRCTFSVNARNALLHHRRLHAHRATQ